MLIPLNRMVEHFNMNIRGILHVGAHECEEQPDYIAQGVKNENIHWVEAMRDKVEEMLMRNPMINIYQAVISDKNDDVVEFKITNNGQSSSILSLGAHLQHHPHVHVTETRKLRTSRLDKVIETNNINMETINFMNLDIQGAELLALKSMEGYLHHIDYIYTEVNTEKVYEDCALMSEIDEYLAPFGFKRAANRIYKEYGWGDALYIRS